LGGVILSAIWGQSRSKLRRFGCCAPVNIPADATALGWDVDGKEDSRSINYPSVVGMPLFLGHSRPDISFTTHQCAQCTHSPKQIHEDAL
jgi:hypothetical protein